jgi:hypothetical protein
MRARVWWAGLLLAGAAACQRHSPVAKEAVGPRDEQLGNAAPATQPAERSDAAYALGRGSADRPANDIGSPAELPAQGVPFDPASRMVIRTGNASLEIDSLEPGIAALRALAARVGGYVANASIQGGRDQVRHATLELKVPADRFDELTSGLEPLGRLEYVNVAAQDVGEEFVDLTARAANARRLEERLIELLASRTGRLQDVLSVERELARVREEIERIEGRLRYLKARAALSTLSVSLHEPPPIVGDNPGRHLIAEAFRQAWRNFAVLLAASIGLLGYAVPVAGALWAAVLLGRRLRRQPA